MSLREYPTYTKHSPQTRVRERLGTVVTRHGVRKFVPAKTAPVETGLQPEVPEEVRKANLRAGIFTFGKPKRYVTGQPRSRRRH